MNQEDNHSCVMYDIVDETQRSFEKAIMYLGSHTKKIENQAAEIVYVSKLLEGGELVSMKVQYKSWNIMPLCLNCATLKYIKYQTVMFSLS